MGKMHAPNNPPTPEQRAKGGRAQRGNTYKKITCPKCGKEFGNLPNHLPTCDGGAGDGE